MRRSGRPAEGARSSGTPFWCVEGSRKIPCARGHGAVPGEQFLGKPDPGRIYEEIEADPHIPGALGHRDSDCFRLKKLSYASKS